MRLIDADALKEWVENWFTMNRHYHPYSKSNNIPTTELIDIIDRMPTVNAVGVVRCKDCKWFNDWGCAIRIIDDSDKPKGSDFCSFAERRQDG